VKHLIALVSISAILVGCDSSPNLEVTTETNFGTNFFGNFTEEQLNIVSREKEKITIKKVIINNDFIAMRTKSFETTINLTNPPEEFAKEAAENLKIVNAQIDSLRAIRQYFFVDSIDNPTTINNKPYSSTYFTKDDSAKCLEWIASDSTPPQNKFAEYDYSIKIIRSLYTCPFKTTYTYTNRRYTVHYESQPELETGNKVSYSMSTFCRIPTEKGEFKCEKPKGEIVNVLFKTSLGDFSGDIVKNQ